MAYIETTTLKGGRKVYRAQVQIAGARFSARFSRKSDIANWEAALRNLYSTNKQHFFSLSDRKTLSDAITRYKETVLSQAGKEKTKIDRIHHLAWWEERIGEHPLHEITALLIEECIDELGKTKSRHGKTRKPATLNRYLASLSPVLSKSVKWGWLNRNPVGDVERPKESRPRQRFLTESEIADVRKACSLSRNKDLELIFMLAICTGMRRGEILNLKYGDIFLHNRTISIKDTKNGESRAAGISDALYPLLSEKLKVRPIDTPLLFPAHTDPLKPMNIKQSWATALKNAGVTDYTFHDNRHTAASYFAMDGASAIQIASILGHKSLQMAKRYSHLSSRAEFEVVNKMNARFEQ